MITLEKANLDDEVIAYKHYTALMLYLDKYLKLRGWDTSEL